MPHEIVLRDTMKTHFITRWAQDVRNQAISVQYTSSNVICYLADYFFG